MLQLINFIKRNNVVIVFIILESIAFSAIIRSHSFHYTKYINSANAVTGTIHKQSNAITSYFNLKSQNKSLRIENELLKNTIEKQFKNHINTQIIDSAKYQYISARVLDNPYSKRDNILTLDKGSKDGIEPGMGVVQSNGIIGITLNTSKHFTTVLSILNTQAKFNAKLSKSHHYGSLIWNAESFTTLRMIDLPIQANIKVGDSIISGGKSVIFPEGIPIGRVSDFTIKNKSYSEIIIAPYIDYSALYDVYVVKNTKAAEQLALENKND